MALEVRIPYIDVNIDGALLVEWNVRDGDEVNPGQTLATLETSKVSFDLEAENHGWIKIIAEVSQEIPIGGLVAYILNSPNEKVRVDTAQALPNEEGKKRALMITSKAEKLLTEANIAVEELPSDWHGIIRERQVREFLNQKQTRQSTKQTITESNSIIKLLEEGRGNLNPEFLERLRNDPNTFADLDSETKIFQYRQNGAIIGNEVIFGPASILIAEQIEIGDGVVLEDNCVFRCRSIHLGELGLYRSGLDCMCQHIAIGREAFVARNVVIGRGGYKEPTAILTIGDRVFLGERCLLNTCMPITIGDECFVGQNTAVMTHNIGHSYLDGYENAFAPIRIGNQVQIGINCVLYPGCEVGDRSIIASNSYAINRFPPGKLIMGVPAKIVMESHKEVGSKERLRRFANLIKRFKTLLDVRGIAVKEETISLGTKFHFDYDGEQETILFCHSLDSSKLDSSPMASTIIALEGGKFEQKEDVVYFDLNKRQVHGQPTLVSEGVREFFRKSGLRLSPWPWRYKGGLL